MPSAKKVKVSVTISGNLLSEIDRHARSLDGGTRSGVIENWLRRASRSAAAEKLERDTIAYYENRSKDEAEEDASWSQTSARQFARLDID